MRARRVVRPLVGLGIVVVLVVGSVELIRLGNGDFSSSYSLMASFDNANAGLHEGSIVEARGVQIGTVRSIDLSGGKAFITLDINDRYRVLKGSSATIEPENLFGADQVAIQEPDGATATSGPFLVNGDHITDTASLDELGQLFAAADPLLSRIDTADLARVVDELSSAYGGEGAEIASSLRAGTALSGLLARTTNAQLQALDAFTRLTVAIDGEGPVFDQLGSDANKTLPMVNAAENAYQQLLTYLATFGSDLAALLKDYRPNIDTILDEGGNVTRVLLAQRSNLGTLVDGLAQYAERFAHGDGPGSLPDGSKFAFFKTFVMWGDVEQLVCSLIAPPKSGLSSLEPLQQALVGASTPLDCSSELAAFDRAQSAAAPSSSSGSGSSAAGGSGSSKKSQSPSPARKLASGLYKIIGAPEQQVSTSIGSYVDSLLPVRPGL